MKRPSRLSLLIAAAMVPILLVGAGAAFAFGVQADEPDRAVTALAGAAAAPEHRQLPPPDVTAFSFTSEPGESLHISAARLAPANAGPGPYTTSTDSSTRPAGLVTVPDGSGFVFHAGEPGVVEFRATVFGGDGMRVNVVRVTLVVAEPEPEPFGPTDDRFKIPALGIDAKLKAMSVSDDGRVTPPTAADVYAIRGYGDPRVLDSGTTHLAVHSGRGGVVGNQLVDVSGKSSVVESGTRIMVAGAPYVVTGSLVVGKAELSSVDELWSGMHDLIIYTCLPNGSKSTDNVVILAQRS